MMNKLIYSLLLALQVLLLAAPLLAEFLPVLSGWTFRLEGWMALLLGLGFALLLGKAFPDFNKVMSKRLLQWSVVGLGFGMTLQSAINSGAAGMLITIVSVFATLAVGTLIGRRLLGVDWQTSYLISSGTAICGGSAIAAVGPVINARSENMSVALGVVFILNAVALIIFPPIGHCLDLTQTQFGTWAAIAIHDTSSVVGAGGAYGDEAQMVATTVKLTRALWIVVLALITPFVLRTKIGGSGQAKRPWYKTVPQFIIWFIAAILFNTFVLSRFAEGIQASTVISSIAKSLITLSLFFIGAGLTRDTLKAVGIRPLVQGVLLWIVVSITSLAYILL